MSGLQTAVLAARLRFTEDALILMEDRLEFLKQHYASKPDFTTHHDPNAEHPIHVMPGSAEHEKQVHKVVDYWASHDPTPNKQYTGRVLHWYHQKGIRQEDHPRVQAALEGFHAYKSRMPEKDINKYPSLQHLETEVDKVKGSGVQTKSMAKSADEETLDQHSKKIHGSPNLTIRQINTGGHKAMGILSRNTRWCVSNEGTFEGYAKRGPLYWMHDKNANKRYLYHPQSDQLMKEDDSRADHNQMMHDMPEIKDVMHGKGHHFTDPVRLHQELKAGKHVEPNVREWMAKNTDHQELLTHLLPQHPADVLGNKHFKNWAHVRKMLLEPEK